MDNLMYINAQFAACSDEKASLFEDELYFVFKEVFDKKIEVPGSMWRGYHRCCCGVASDNIDYYVTIGNQRFKTNSLALHYLHKHRFEVPVATLQLLSNQLLGADNEYLKGNSYINSIFGEYLSDKENFVQAIRSQVIQLTSNTSKRIRAKASLEKIRSQAIACVFPHLTASSYIQKMGIGIDEI